MFRLRHSPARRSAAWLSIALLLVQVACHSYLPVQSSPPPNGGIIGVVLNDQGRFLTGSRLGSSIERVEGVVITQTDSVIRLGVTGTQSLEGTRATWTGEEVEIPRQGIAGFQTRQFSRGRTVFVVAVTVGALALIGGIISLAVGGLGRSGDDPGCALCPEQ